MGGTPEPPGHTDTRKSGESPEPADKRISGILGLLRLLSGFWASLVMVPTDRAHMRASSFTGKVGGVAVGVIAWGARFLVRSILHHSQSGAGV